MENYARQLKGEVEKFEKDLGLYQFDIKGSKFTIKSANFAGDRKGLLKFVQKNLVDLELSLLLMVIQVL